MQSKCRRKHFRVGILGKRVRTAISAGVVAPEQRIILTEIEIGGELSETSKTENDRKSWFVLSFFQIMSPSQGYELEDVSLPGCESSDIWNSMFGILNRFPRIDGYNWFRLEKSSHETISFFSIDASSRGLDPGFALRFELVGRDFDIGSVF